MESIPLPIPEAIIELLNKKMQDYNEVETLKKENQDSQMPGSENGNISKEIHARSNYKLQKPRKNKKIKEKFTCHSCKLFYRKLKECCLLEVEKLKNSSKDNCKHCEWLISHDLQKKQKLCPFCERQF